MHPRAPKLLEDIRNAADFVKTATLGVVLTQFKQDRLLRWGEGGASTLVEFMPQWGGTIGLWRLCSKKLSPGQSGALLPIRHKAFLGGRCVGFGTCSKPGANAFNRR